MDDKIPLERAITDQIIAWLKANGYEFVIKTHGGIWQAAGLPDIITIGAGGRFVGLEVKRPGIGKLTKLQAKVLGLIARCGGCAAVVCSVEDVADVMRRADC